MAGFLGGFCIIIGPVSLFWSIVCLYIPGFFFFFIIFSSQGRYHCYHIVTGFSFESIDLGNVYQVDTAKSIRFFFPFSFSFSFPQDVFFVYDTIRIFLDLSYVMGLNKDVVCLLYKYKTFEATTARSLSYP